MKVALWWLRRDLRLHDNAALNEALESGQAVVPIFVLDPRLVGSNRVGPHRLAFLFGGLRALDADLRARGAPLIIRSGDPLECLTRLCSELRASGHEPVAIHAEADASPYARARDAHVAAALPLKLAGGASLVPPGELVKADGRPYTVFTPFSKAWKARPVLAGATVLPPPERLRSLAGLASQAIPDTPALDPRVPFPPGESEARRRLAAFAAALPSAAPRTEDLLGSRAAGDAQPLIYAYAELRDRPDRAATSQLSPYLRFGMLSIREAALAAGAALAAAPDAAARRGAQTWLDELIWREFFQHILHHFPELLGQSFRPRLRAIEWRQDPEGFAAWREGRTGYPVVDAAMRALAEQGWMHNRARMLVASFLVKDLLVDWRLGERYFMQQLVDGDPAANNGGWQWAAGTGTDAAPYFRVFNPVLQGRRFDPEGRYVRRWLPELAKVPLARLHAPWTMSPAEQAAAACRIGRDYPAPIVDHARARARALAAFRQAGQPGDSPG